MEHFSRRRWATISYSVREGKYFLFQLCVHHFFKMGQSRPLFVYYRLIYMTQINYINWQKHSVLWIQTQGGRMEGVYESTELWRHPCVCIIFKLIYDGAHMVVHFLLLKCSMPKLIILFRLNRNFFRPNCINQLFNYLVNVNAGNSDSPKRRIQNSNSAKYNLPLPLWIYSQASNVPTTNITPAWPDKSCQMSTKFAQKWFH